MRLLLAIVVLVGCDRGREGGSLDDCCAVCSVGQPCGDSCISATDQCFVGGGCACDESGNHGSGDPIGGEGEGEGAPECVDDVREYDIGSEFCECPDYWTCIEDCGDSPSSGLKACTQPFPDAPGGTDWGYCYEMEDESVITCEGEAATFDDTDADGWTCEVEGDFVICTKAPEFPDGGDGADWYCEWNGRERSCFYDDSADWECATAADGTTECVSDSPDPGYPDEDEEWDCWIDDSGATHCTNSP